MTDLAKLRALAEQRARTDLSSLSTYQADLAFEKAFSPRTVIALVAVAEAARGMPLCEDTRPLGIASHGAVAVCGKCRYCRLDSALASLTALLAKGGADGE